MGYIEGTDIVNLGELINRNNHKSYRVLNSSLKPVHELRNMI